MHRFRTRVGSLVLVLGSLLLAARRAGAHAAHLEWSAPASCGDGGALRASVERLLGEALEEGSTFRAEAKITADADSRFTLTLSIRTPDGEGTRSVRADTCDSALQVAAFAIALAINPELVSENPETQPQPPPTAPPPAKGPAEPPEPAPSTPPSPPPAASERPQPGRPPELWLGAHALLDSSLLPNAAFGAQANADVLLFGHLRLGLGGELFLPQAASLANGPGGYFSLWTLEARGCGQLTLGVEAALCPLFRFGSLHGEGRGVSPRLGQTSHFYAPGVAVLGLLGLSPRIALSLRLAGVFPLSREVFVVRAGPVHGLPPVSLELGLGVAVRAF